MKTNMANTVSRKEYVSPEMVNLTLCERDVLNASAGSNSEIDYEWDWGTDL